MIHFKTLEIWQLSIELSTGIYTVTESFPKTELYSLVDQIKRASTSISANIAEGDGRGTDPDNIRFLHIARGSAYELYSHLITAEKIGFISTDTFAPIEEKIILLIRKISAYINYKQR
jgi:four helix bundle protein